MYYILRKNTHTHTNTHINKMAFCVPEAGIKATPGFHPTATIFQCRCHWSNILDAKFSKSHVFLLQCFWSQWWQPDILWATLPLTTVEVFPSSSPCGGAMASLFYIQNPMQKYGCVPQTTWSMTTEPKCLRWPEHTLQVTSDDSTAYVRCSCVHSAADFPLTSEQVWNVPTL